MESAPERQEFKEDAKEDIEPSTESLLEALLVGDAEIVWDPVSGRPKIVLDRPSDTP
jgi:hypothetical protein